MMFRPGARLGIDVGEARIGVAQSDPSGLLATPVETVRRGAGDVGRIIDLVQELNVVEIVVGLPITLAGRHGTAAERAEAFARRLDEECRSRNLAVSTRLSDERLTTVSAERVLREQGRSGAKRRAVVDQAAAVEILQYAIDRENRTGVPPGSEVGRETRE